MSVKIIKIENDGFNPNEIEFLTKAFITTIEKLSLELAESEAWLEAVELEDSNIMMIITLKKINGYRQWEGKVFASHNSLRIVAIKD